MAKTESAIVGALVPFTLASCVSAVSSIFLIVRLHRLLGPQSAKLMVRQMYPMPHSLQSLSGDRHVSQSQEGPGQIGQPGQPAQVKVRVVVCECPSTCICTCACMCRVHLHVHVHIRSFTHTCACTVICAYINVYTHLIVHGNLRAHERYIICPCACTCMIVYAGS